MNWYVHTENDPVNYIDPWGLAAEDRENSHVESRITALGPYGDPRTRNGAILMDVNGPPRIDIRRYEDYRGIEGMAESISQLDNHENGYGQTRAISGPNIIEGITNFRKGKAFLVTYNNPKTEGLDGHEVYLIDKPDADSGLYPKYPQGDPLPSDQAQQVLKSRPNLIDSALSEDLRPLYKKVLDWIF